MTTGVTGASQLRGSGIGRRVGLGSSIRKVLIYVTLIALTMVFTFPLLWMISTSLKIPEDLYKYPPSLIPRPVAWWNYVDFIARFPVLQAGRNTLFIVVLVEIGVLLSNSLVAYSFARLRFPGREWLFLLVVSTMMIPGTVTLIPTYVLFSKFGWLDSFLPLTVPAFFGSAFYIFLLRQFLVGIPKEMDDAARIDGCGFFGIFWRIMLPLTKPALTTVAIFTFMATWGDYFAPSIYLNNQDKMTLAVSIKFWAESPAVQGMNQYPFSWVMGMAFLLTVPPLLVFFFLQRRFIQGIVFTGVKG